MRVARTWPLISALTVAAIVAAGCGTQTHPQVSKSTRSVVASTATNAAEGRVLTTIDVGTSAGMAAYDPVSGYIYVPVADGIAVIDGYTNRLIRILKGVSGNESGYDPGTGRIYDVNFYGSTLTWINRFKASVGPNLSNADLVNLPTYDPENKNLYFPFGNGGDQGLVAVDPASGPTSHMDTVTIQVSACAWDGFNTAYDSRTGYLFAPMGTDGAGQAAVAVIDPSSGQVVSVVASTQTGGCAQVAYYDPVDGNIYVEGDGNVFVLNGVTGRFMRSIVTSLSDFYRMPLAFDLKTGDVYIVNPGNQGGGNSLFSSSSSGSVSVISPTQGKQASPVQVGKNPFWAAYDPKDDCIYVSNYTSGTVSVISGATNRLVATVRVGRQPECVLYDPANGDMYVVNSGSGTVTVLSS